MPLDNLLRDKAVLKQEDFEKTEQSKTTGQSAGYTAKEKATGNIFMLKSFKKDFIHYTNYNNNLGPDLNNNLDKQKSASQTSLDSGIGSKSFF